MPRRSAKSSPRIAASADAAAPSTTVFSSSDSRKTARASACSSTVTTRSTSGAASGNDTSPTFPTANPSARVGRRGTCIGRPAASEAEKLPAAAGSTAMTEIVGRTAFAAIATPARRPAPPVGTMIASASGTSASTSRAIVPCPAITRGSSKPWISSSPSRAAISTALARASSNDSPSRMTFAPRRRQVATFTSGANRGITTVTGISSRRPCQASPRAWLPALAAMTPRERVAASRSSRALRAPRSLNEPVRWRRSSLHQTRKPVSSERGMLWGQGVRAIPAAIRFWAARIVSIVTAGVGRRAVMG